MHIVLFFLLSFFEYVAIYYLTFRLFSFEFRFYTKQICLSSFLLTFISYLFRMYSFGFLDVFLQIVIFIFLLRYLFRIHLYYSVLVSYGYITYVIMQILIFTLLDSLQLLDNILSIESTGTYIIQVVSIAAAFLVGVLLAKTHFRFSFVPTAHYGNVALRGNNLSVFLLTIFEILILGASYSYYTTNFNKLYFLFVLILFVLAVVILYLLNKKEFSND